LRRENGHYHIELSEGGEVAARSVIAATGGPATAGCRYLAWSVSRA
jgi:hypothetical protein